MDKTQPSKILDSQPPSAAYSKKRTPVKTMNSEIARVVTRRMSAVLPRRNKPLYYETSNGLGTRKNGTHTRLINVKITDTDCHEQLV